MADIAPRTFGHAEAACAPTMCLLRRQGRQLPRGPREGLRGALVNERDDGAVYQQSVAGALLHQLRQEVLGEPLAARGDRKKSGR